MASKGPLAPEWLAFQPSIYMMEKMINMLRLHREGDCNGGTLGVIIKGSYRRD